MYDSMRRWQIWKSDFSETIKWNYWCECELMQSSTTYDGTFTCRDTAMKIEIILFGDPHFFSSWSEWSLVFASGEHHVHYKHSAAFVSKTLRSFWTHYCVPLEHTATFDSVRNEHSAFASKHRWTHQDVNMDAGECRVRSFWTQLCFFFCFNCSNSNAFALRW